jgi:thiol-disulfide isomerase/thioredoxin
LTLASPARAVTLVINAPAPNFAATIFDGQELTLADFKGQVVILNFWATWCVPCKEELPLLEGYYRGMAKYGLRVLAVATEDSVPPAKLKPLAEKLTLSLVRHMHGDYGILNHSVPTNYIIDRAGILRYGQAGAFSLDDLNTILVPMLREAAPVGTAPVGDQPPPKS